MALVSKEFIERSLKKWPQAKIDALGIEISQDGKPLMKANGTMKRADRREAMRLVIRR